MATPEIMLISFPLLVVLALLHKARRRSLVIHGRVASKRMRDHQNLGESIVAKLWMAKLGRTKFWVPCLCGVPNLGGAKFWVPCLCGVPNLGGAKFWVPCLCGVPNLGGAKFWVQCSC